MRIIAGKYKGKVLNSFEADNIRPTSDMVKEAICSKFQFEFPDSTVLDLFGGTGNFGFEVLSRGAKKVVICDTDIRSINIIKKNNTLLKADAEIIQGDYNKCLKLLMGKYKFDFIFLDPPYKTTYGEQAMQLIKKYDLLAEDGDGINISGRMNYQRGDSAKRNITNTKNKYRYWCMYKGRINDKM